jgi:hypothetical protein
VGRILSVSIIPLKGYFTAKQITLLETKCCGHYITICKRGFFTVHLLGFFLLEI